VSALWEALVAYPLVFALAGAILVLGGLAAVDAVKRGHDD
jgi:hypothetical protein